jgi:hypothetical protein
MANTFELISSVTVGSGGAADITFNTIPSTYTDLCLVLSSRTASGGAADVLIQFNTDSTSGNYSQRQLQGAGSGTPGSGTGNQQSATSSGSSDTASTFANSQIYIPNYAGSTNKSFSTDSVTENNATTAYATLRAGLWSNTSVINAIKLTHNGGASFAQYSTAYLYGVKNA